MGNFENGIRLKTDGDKNQKQNRPVYNTRTDSNRNRNLRSRKHSLCFLFGKVNSLNVCNHYC